MKTILLFSISIIIFLSSCMSTRELVAEEQHFYSIDFVKYSDQGFYISPEHPEGKYIPVSLLDYQLIPEARYVKKQTTDRVNNLDGSETIIIGVNWVWNQPAIVVDNCLQTVVNFCTEMGANAIYNFNLESIDKEIIGVTNPTKLSGIRITGFAVKVED